MRLITDHDFYCTKCGKKGIPICRKNRMREAGHLKRLYCLNCDEVVNHVECVAGTNYDSSIFEKEFADGNFGSDGLRIKPYKEWRRIEPTEGEQELVEDLSEEEWMMLFGRIS